MIKYLGSKRLLLPAILEAVGGAAPPGSTVLDLFSGTSRVGHALKRAGYRVLASDHNAYAHTLARCYVQADAEEVLAAAASLVEELNALARRSDHKPGWFTRDYCERSRYFRPENGARIEAVRSAIAAKDLSPDLEAVMLVSLLEAADRVDSTTGVQMAYLKDWAPRALNTLELRVPDVLPRPGSGPCGAHGLDAFAAAAALAPQADVVYVDPPYNQHSYLGNYHVWETLVRWDEPEVYGVACKRADVRERRSVFNSRRGFAEAFSRLLAILAGSPRVEAIVVSFSDEGYLARDDLERTLAALWGSGTPLRVQSFGFKRYVGAQIGIHNPRGEKVGKISHLRNTEHLFIATRPAQTATATPASDRPAVFAANS